MKILSHRGFWHAPSEKNHLSAFKRTVAHGFGTETDVRDQAGLLFISHDPISGDAMPLNDLIDIFASASARPLSLAINIKADGLAVPLAAAFGDRDVDWFAFDMSVPDMLHHIRIGNPVFGRMSEYEPLAAELKSDLRGIWLDSFRSDWFGKDLVQRLLDDGLEVCVVSPELHGRSFERQWEMLARLIEYDSLMLCTDHPERAALFLGIDAEQACTRQVAQ